MDLPGSQAGGCKHTFHGWGFGTPTSRSCDASRTRRVYCSRVPVPSAEDSRLPHQQNRVGQNPRWTGTRVLCTPAMSLGCGTRAAPGHERVPPPAAWGLCWGPSGLVGAGLPDAHGRVTGQPEVAGPVQERPGPEPTGRAVFIWYKPGQERRPFLVTLRTNH